MQKENIVLRRAVHFCFHKNKFLVYQTSIIQQKLYRQDGRAFIIILNNDSIYNRRIWRRECARLANVHIRRTMSLKMASRIKLFYGTAVRFAPRKRASHMRYFVLGIWTNGLCVCLGFVRSYLLCNMIYFLLT